MIHKKNTISIVWDFDKTLASVDSTTELIKIFLKDLPIESFGKRLKISQEHSLISLWIPFQPAMLRSGCICFQS